MSKHTPGPWTGTGPSYGDPLPRYIDTIIADRNEEDECIEICTLPVPAFDEESDANFKLIAAAPDLLAMLAEAHDIIDAIGQPETAEVAARMRATIAKARGEA
jgi:hypothetical protein